MTLKNKNYQPVPLWAKLPHPMRFQEATSVATDSNDNVCLLYTSPSPRDATLSRMPSSA